MNSNAGQICGIFISEQREIGVIALNEAEIIEDWGLHGDRKARAGSPRQVLLVDEATLHSVDLQPGALNENVTIRGLDINNLRSGQHLRIGSALVEITGPCTVCGELEHIRSGLKERLRGRRGMLARVLRSGTAKIGDSVWIEQ
jgi:MOSC domain-containing protein YiiM